MSRQKYEPDLEYTDEGDAFDKDTGEIYDASNSYGFIKLFEEGFEKLERAVGSAPIRVLLYLIRNMDKKNNICQCTQQTIAKKMKLSRRSVCSILQQMEKEALILSGRGHYQVDPKLFWHGDERSRRKTIAVYHKKKNLKLKKPK